LENCISIHITEQITVANTETMKGGEKWIKNYEVAHLELILYMIIL